MSFKTGTCGKCESALDGAHRSYCKSCYADYARSKYIDSENAKARYDATQRWKQRNPEKWNKIRRNSILKREYGITLHDFEKMLQTQNFECAICHGELAPWPHLDHNHSTGKLREILCGGCNIGIGHLKDDPSTADAMAAYLRKHL